MVDEGPEEEGLGGGEVEGDMQEVAADVVSVRAGSLGRGTPPAALRSFLGGVPP